MSATQQYVESNKQYASSRKAEQLPMPPSKKIAILTCMDARILPETILGLGEGEAHVIRNAGGRAPEAIRSLIISQQLLGTQEILLVQHTDCGMLTFTTDQARDVESNLKKDVEFLKSNELIKSDKITGWIYDVKTGTLSQVA